jgi:hypothetical protein
MILFHSSEFGGKQYQIPVEILFMSLAATRRVIKDFHGVPKFSIDFKYHNKPSIS